jgi:ABC-type branched-subunit amino acid transport system ATPase component
MQAIEVRNLVKRYDGRAIVDRVSFAVDVGEIFGIVGPNGAGKTTIVETIEGLRRPDEGRIRVFGLDPQGDAADVHAILGAQLQESRLPDKLRVWEALDLYASFYRDPAPRREFGPGSFDVGAVLWPNNQEALDAVGLSLIADRTSNGRTDPSIVTPLTDVKPSATFKPALPTRIRCCASEVASRICAVV